ncbi:MAG: glycosyltransferase family 39 protein [Deltaproteobacteria bacterium]|nr:glycosyltransferase family 39 protein [Deltaproteobacteria bacterium]
MHGSPASGRAAAWTVAALTVAAALLRAPTLGRSLWLDEAWRANVALAPHADAFWTQVLGGGGITAPMPPLFALALRAISAVVGHSALGMRALPVVASVAAVPLAWVVARRAAGPAAGLVAALLFAASPTALLHGQELKQYSTDITVVLLLLAAAGAVARTPAPRRWLALALLESTAPGLSYPSALVLPGIALATFAACRDGAARRRWVAAHVVSGAATLAWYALVIGPQRARPVVAAYWAGDFPPIEGVPGAGWVVERLGEFLGYASLRPTWLTAMLVVAGLALAARWLGVAALASLATVVVAAAWRVYPLAGGRTTTFLLPFVYLGVGAAAAPPAGRRPLPAAARALLALASAVVVAPTILAGLRAPAAGVVYEETAPLVAALAAARQPGDRVYVYDGAVQAFRFHHPALDPAITLGGSHRSDPAAYGAELKPFLVPGRRLWLLFSHVHTAATGRSERDAILADLTPYARQLDVREAAGGASLHLFEVVRAPGEVRHLKLTPQDLADPARMKELLGR